MNCPFCDAPLLSSPGGLLACITPTCPLGNVSLVMKDWQAIEQFLSDLVKKVIKKYGGKNAS
jgi:hypothetical protein